MTHYEKEQQILVWLREYKYLQASIKYLEANIIDIIEAGFGVQYDKDVISKTNNINSVVENSVIKIEKLDIYRKIKSMKNIIKAIDTSLEILDTLEKTVILKRCVENKSYYEFIKPIGISERTARRIKKGALNKMSLIVFGKG